MTVGVPETNLNSWGITYEYIGKEDIKWDEAPVKKPKKTKPKVAKPTKVVNPEKDQQESVMFPPEKEDGDGGYSTRTIQGEPVTLHSSDWKPEEDKERDRRAALTDKERKAEDKARSDAYKKRTAEETKKKPLPTKTKKPERTKEELEEARSGKHRLGASEHKEGMQIHPKQEEKKDKIERLKRENEERSKKPESDNSGSTANFAITEEQGTRQPKIGRGVGVSPPTKKEIEDFKIRQDIKGKDKKRGDEKEEARRARLDQALPKGVESKESKHARAAHSIPKKNLSDDLHGKLQGVKDSWKKKPFKLDTSKLNPKAIVREGETDELSIYNTPQKKLESGESLYTERNPKIEKSILNYNFKSMHKKLKQIVKSINIRKEEINWDPVEAREKPKRKSPKELKGLPRAETGGIKGTESPKPIEFESGKGGTATIADTGNWRKTGNRQRRGDRKGTKGQGNKPTARLAHIAWELENRKTGKKEGFKGERKHGNITNRFGGGRVADQGIKDRVAMERRSGKQPVASDFDKIGQDTKSRTHIFGSEGKKYLDEHRNVKPKTNKKELKALRDRITSGKGTEADKEKLLDYTASHQSLHEQKFRKDMKDTRVGRERESEMGEAGTEDQNIASERPEKVEARAAKREKKRQTEESKAKKERKFIADHKRANELQAWGKALRNRKDRETFRKLSIADQQAYKDKQEKRKKQPSRKKKAWEVWLDKDALDNRERVVAAKPKKEGQTHGAQSTNARITGRTEENRRDLTYNQMYGRRGAPHGKIFRHDDPDHKAEGETQNPAYRGQIEEERELPKIGTSPKLKGNNKKPSVCPDCGDDTTDDKGRFPKYGHINHHTQHDPDTGKYSIDVKAPEWHQFQDDDKDPHGMYVPQGNDLVNVDPKIHHYAHQVHQGKTRKIKHPNVKNRLADRREQMEAHFSGANKSQASYTILKSKLLKVRLNL